VYAIISHDVDHINLWDHKSDLIIPKWFLRTLLEFGDGKISFTEVLFRFNELFTNKWNRIDELCKHNKSMNIPSTFFVGVSNGMGLTYSKIKAQWAIQKVLSYRNDVGIHGIAYDSIKEIEEERNLFLSFIGHTSFGVRMHYLRQDFETLNNLSKVGYHFDSTEYSLNKPYKIGNMWEFPIHLMDGVVIEYRKRRQSISLDIAKELTKRRIDEVISSGNELVNIIFHDRYFSKSYSTWQNWYVWLIDWLKKNNFTLLSFNDAIQLLENQKLNSQNNCV